MFYSDVILSKKGKLSKVWLAAHAERRMTKAMILDTNIVKSVSSIINKRDEQNAVPMALRLSGQLLFGVVRIYSRQAKYLLDDCNEALIKLKTAFRSGVVDMTMQTSRSAITLPNRSNVLDLALPDPMFEGWDVNSRAGSTVPQGTPRSTRSESYTARLEDISLPRLPGQSPAPSRFPGFDSTDFFDPDAGQELGMGLDQAEAGEPRRRDSQGREVDANGDPIQEDDERSSIGLAREAASQAGRLSLGLGDVTGFDDFAPEDMVDAAGLDFGLEEFDAQRRQREVTPVGTQSLIQDLTPRTALKVQQAAEKRAAVASTEKSRKQIVDSRTELQDELSQAHGANVAALLTDERYLPRSKAYMQLLDLHANPGRHILPFTSSTSNFNFMASRGLDPKLNELFNFDATVLRRRRSPSVDVQLEERRLEKRARTESFVGGDDTSIGIGRRASVFGAGDDLPDLGADDTFGNFGEGFGGEDEMLLDLPTIEADTSANVDLGLRRSTRKRATDDQRERENRNAFDLRGDLPRLATPSTSAEGEARESTQGSPTSSNLLRAFDQSAPIEGTNLAAETQASTQAGMSKNTARAIKVLRKELSPGGPQGRGEEGGGGEHAAEANVDRNASFQKITTNATRRAAAGFFFELLVLSSKGCIKVEQEESYADINIAARPSLWTEESQSNRRDAVAVS